MSRPDIKVHIHPFFAGEDKADGGVRRVVDAERKHLPAYGFQIVDSLEDADIIGCHILATKEILERHVDKPLVIHSHGLYWSEFEWKVGWCYKANAKCMESIRQADAVTAPTEWVAQAIRRHSLRPVTVIGHGVDLEEFPKPTARHMGYVLWNKTRLDPVCTDGPLNELAKLAPDVQFISTYGDKALSNLRITGALNYEKAKQAVRDAAVYLCTPRETFGIGTLEAMAAGVPVLAWDWGGQSDIIDHKETGWLAHPGDFDSLLEGLHYCLENRTRLGRRAREVVEERYQWKNVCKGYADLYRSVLKKHRRKGPRVSVIVTAYNLAEYLPAALDSIVAQSFKNWECIIVDDASPDKCGKIADSYALKDSRFKVIHNEKNQYLSGALNIGIAAARGRYIIPVDADNILPPKTLTMLSDALDATRTIDIAYGNVRFVARDGKTPIEYRGNHNESGHSGWPFQFRADWQLIRRAGDGRPANLVPSTAMFRKEAWEAVGGYRRRWRTAEDADFWTRLTSYGFRAEMVTQKDTLIYRNREEAMSRVEQWQDWTKWYPWCQGTAFPPAAVDSGKQAPISSHDPPQIAVVIPVGPEHQELYIDAVDSVDSQDFRWWECIIVNDTGGPLRWVPSWAKLINTEGKIGVAAARNLGITAAKAHLFVPLDADDTLEPDALQKMFDLFERIGGYIYTDFHQLWKEKEPDIWHCPEYEPKRLLFEGALHAVTGLYRKADWKKVGGFDEEMVAWEDWDFQLKLANIGVCGTRIPEPLFTYRKETGFRREENYQNWRTSKNGMIQRWQPYFEGKKELMACGGCPGGGGQRVPPRAATRRPSVPSSEEAKDFVIVEYTGQRQGALSYRGPSGQPYKFSSLPNERLKYVKRGADVDFFGQFPDFQVREFQPEREAVRALG